MTRKIAVKDWNEVKMFTRYIKEHNRKDLHLLLDCYNPPNEYGYRWWLLIDFD